MVLPIEYIKHILTDVATVYFWISPLRSLRYFNVVSPFKIGYVVKACEFKFLLLALRTRILNEKSEA